MKNVKHPLGSQWISKTLLALPDHPSIFFDDYAPVILGTGYQQVKSIRFYMEALGIIKQSIINKKSHYLTDFGKVLHDYDPFADDINIRWILHYKLSTNPKLTHWYFIINKLQTRRIKLDQIKSYMPDFKKSDYTTLQNIMKIYLQDRSSMNPEDTYYSPLSNIPFLKSKKLFYIEFNVLHYFQVPRKIVDYAVFMLLKSKTPYLQGDLNMPDLLGGERSPTRILNLSYNGLYEYIADTLMDENSPIKRTDRLTGTFIYDRTGFNELEIVKDIKFNIK